MTNTEITALADQVIDLAETIGDEVTRVEFMEAADGSGRALALLYTYDRTNDLEQEFRLLLAAPDWAPAWAGVFTKSVLEVRVGDGWKKIDA